MSDLRVRVVIRRTHEMYGSFCDSLELPASQLVDETSLAAIVNCESGEALQRFNNWVNAVSNPPTPEPVDPLVVAASEAARIRADFTRLAEMLNSDPLASAEELDVLRTQVNAVAGALAETDPA